MVRGAWDVRLNQANIFVGVQGVENLKGISMRNQIRSIRFTLLFVAVGLMLIATFAAAQTESVLYNFTPNGIDGNSPIAGLTWGAGGNLYGTTYDGGRYLGGTVFQLSPQSGGGWTETLLHTFGTGQQPWGPLTADSAGNLYGTTTGGGSFGKGIVFEISPVSGGGWTYKRLHAFGNGKDGFDPMGGLVLDAAGNLYGTTGGGGAYDDGTVFELTPGTGGFWTEKILHHFHPSALDGYYPVSGLTFDGSGNLYGTAMKGGTNPGSSGLGAGTIFKLTPSSGGWTYKTIHEFNIKNGENPEGALLVDAAGNLYGTTTIGGAYQSGTAFELSPTGAGGGWVETILHSFNDSTSVSDGYNPYPGLIADGSGNLYGTTYVGGSGYGIVFKLTPTTSGWTETILHTFFPGYPDYDGIRPYGGVIFDGSGDLYGTTSSGGPNGTGTIFEITP
jgi:uncharacterized repeat protein (TIGR03803 family)